MRKIIISLPLLATLLTAVAASLVVGVQQEAYAQAAFFTEVNEQHQALISQVFNRLQNQTADRISIFGDSGNMVVTWTENISATAPDGTVFEITRDTTLTAPTNFTTANGYQYRDNTIFKPDGTELFASE